MARDDAGEQIEVILDHARMNGLGSDVDHARPWLGEQEEEKKKTLFIGLHFEAGDGQLDRHRGYDHNRLLFLVETLDRTPERHQLLLQRIELRSRLVCGETGGQSNERGIDW